MHDAKRGRDALGRRAAALREALGFTPDELARRAGTGADVVTAIEEGRAPVTLDDLARIAMTLGCTLVDLVADIPPYGVPPGDGARRDGALRDDGVVRSAFLADVSERLAASLDLPRSMALLAHVLVPRLADGCVVQVLDETALHQVVSLASDGTRTGEIRSTHQAEELPRLVQRVVRTGAPVLETAGIAADAIIAPGDDIGDLRGMRASSALVVPLAARGETFGALALLSLQPDRRYDEGSVTLVRDIARRASLALDNARLYQERSRVARVLQSSLLPPTLPRIPGVELAAEHRPAGEKSEIGGDFYDAFQIGARSWSVVVGDVCGKGPQAAALTGVARHTIRASAMQDESPRGVLETLNDAVLERGDGRFCTVSYMRVEPSPDGVRLVASAGGHPDPLVLRADGRVEAVRTPGMLLGVFPDVELTEAELVLGPGDAIVLYTDGVTEARRGMSQFGGERLQALLSAVVGLDAAGLAARIVREVFAWLRGGSHDDIAVLVVRVPPETG